MLIQDLPFTIKLKNFIIDFYSTGMPKLFASEVAGDATMKPAKTFPATIKVNQPLIYKGVAVYQSSFEDGGTKLKLTGLPDDRAASRRFALEGEVGGIDAAHARRAGEYTVEWSGFRPFNVENMAPGGRMCAPSPRASRWPSSCCTRTSIRLGRQERQQQGSEKRRPQRAVQAARQDRPGARIPATTCSR